jgi:hypothetical protein
MVRAQPTWQEARFVFSDKAIRKFGLAWVCLMAAFFVASYGLVWVWGDFGFAGIAEVFRTDEVFGPIGMVLCFLPGVLALALSAWLKRARP